MALLIPPLRRTLSLERRCAVQSQPIQPPITLRIQVELVLNKRDIRSWNLLEKTDADLGAFNLTFGVGGRTGTIGGKEPILDESNKYKE